MNEAAADMDSESEEPHDDENDDYEIKHAGSTGMRLLRFQEWDCI